MNIGHFSTGANLNLKVGGKIARYISYMLDTSSIF